MTGKKIAGIVMTALGSFSTMQCLLFSILFGIATIVILIISSTMKVDYNTETDGYVYKVTDSQTSLMYVDEYGDVCDKTFNIRTSRVKVYDTVTVQYHDSDPSDIYVPELMESFDMMIWMFGGFTLFLGIVPLIIWSVILIVGITLIRKSKPVSEPVNNV